MTFETNLTQQQELIVVLGGTGKTGRRIVAQLAARNIPHRIGSRSAEIPFEWTDQTTWSAVLEGATAVYVCYHPDLAAPGATDVVQAFTDLAKQQGVKKLVLLSGRGEAEAQLCEEIVMQSGLAWTVVRASWFSQNFSESLFHTFVMGGTLALPVEPIGEPFIDADDIADVAVAALTEPGHEGQLYELTGPQLLTFAEAVETIAEATGRPIQFVQIPLETFVGAMRAEEAPEEIIGLMTYLFTTVLDGRNAHLTDGVQRALGRPPRDFADYAAATAAAGVWDVEVNYA